MIACDPAKIRSGGDSATRDALNAGGGDLIDDKSFTSTTAAFDEGAGFSHCSNASSASATYIGAVQACKNSYDAELIRVRVNQAHESSRTCVVPTFTNSAGSAVPLRLQASCFQHGAGEVMTAKLVSNNPDFPNTPPNSAIIIKESVVPQFYQCMNADKEYIANSVNCCSYLIGRPIANSCQVAQAENACLANAAAYKSGLCNQFKSTYKNQQYLTYQL